MKRFTSILLLAALAFSFTAWSCEQDPEPEQNNEEQQKPEENNNGQNGNTETPTGPQPGTYKFVASPLKGTWKAGDQIYVHGNLGTSAEIVTLAAGDISADGKTATGNLSSVTEAPFDPDGLYAAWPAESVYLYKGVLKIKTTFEKCEDLLTQAYLKDDTFTFTDVSSMISFSVDGDYDNWAICSTDREGICITRFESEYSSQTTKFNYNILSATAASFPARLRYTSQETSRLPKASPFTLPREIPGLHPLPRSMAGPSRLERIWIWATSQHTLRPTMAFLQECPGRGNRQSIPSSSMNFQAYASAKTALSSGVSVTTVNLAASH